MVEVEAGETLEWVQLDGYGQFTGASFQGTVGALKAHLRRGVPDGAVNGPKPADVYVRRLTAKVSCPLVTLTTPWGTTRWIPKPGSKPSGWRRLLG